VDTFPGLPVDNPMSLNVVDICPVGALIDKNFLYQARVWYARETPTTCPSCARGCSVSLTTLDNQIKRVVPRYNPHVNGYWMCDIGRLEARYVHSPRRLLAPRGPWAQARAVFRDGTAAAGTWAIVFSTFQTLEEMFLLKKLAESLGARVAVWSDARGARWEARNGFTIEPDRSPNTAGARMLFGDDAVERGLTGLLEDAPERILLVNGNPRAVWPLELEDAVARAKVSIVCDVMDSPLVAQAQYALPGLTFAEKDGTVVNAGRRLLRFRRAVIPPETAIPEIEWLQEILIARGVRSRTVSAEGVFRELAAEMPSLGVSTYADIGDLGRAVP
jgi:NADH-quinone oxidoreductase subunit G